MVELINNHVLFPEPCNWTMRPSFIRRWENEIAEAVTGAESRRALRVEPRIELSFYITSRSTVELSMLSDRILAASKSGLACSPYHGRGILLDDDASGNEVTVRSGRTWAVGEYIFFQSADDSHEVLTIESTSLDGGVWTLGLSDNLSGEYPAQSFVWPLIFGKFESDTMSAVTPKHGPVRITISEQSSPASVQLGSVAPPDGSGIGSMSIGSTFEVS